MTDLLVQKGTETMVALVQGETDRGVEFLDSWNPLDLIVLDSGRIQIPAESVDALLSLAAERDLTVAMESVL